MKLKRRGVPIVLVVITSVVAVSSAIAMADSPTRLFKGNITSTAPPLNGAGTDLYFYLPIVSRNYPVHGAWLEVGTGSASEGSINSTNGTYGNPSIAIAPDGTPYLAWHDERSGNSQIYVRRWNGMDWEEVGAGSASGGGISNTSGSSWLPSIAIAPDGSPYVTWKDFSSGDFEIYVRRWNGMNWEEVGDGSASGGGISNTSGSASWPSIAIAPDGSPYVAWREYINGDAQIYVRRWNGSIWEEVGAASASGGGISNTSEWSDSPSIAIAPDGSPYVTWDDLSGPSNKQVYVRRWNGVIWEEVGAGSASGGGISDTHNASQIPSITIAPDGTPYIVWDEFVNLETQIYVRRWNGSTWEEVGAGSASGGGITDSFTFSSEPEIAIDPDGRPFITWEDGMHYGDREIYVLSWNGSTWEEVGQGSASGGGMTDNDTHSMRPSIAAAFDGTPYIAWSDGSDDHYEIYVRRWISGN